jgi:3',5'-cyclic AMP phosphodiesterase CpdA
MRKDVTSNADERDFLAVRKLLLELDLLNAERTSVIPGNHDIFGGPQLADDVLGFPERCRRTDYADQLQRFAEFFPECLEGVTTIDGSQFPYAKMVGSTCLIGINSIAEHSFLQNPVGSNGRLSAEDEAHLRALLGLPAVQRARHRVAMLHHHLFPTRDAQRLQDLTHSLGLMQMLEHGTLKLRGKRRVMNVLKSGETDLILHGHVHFSAQYERDGIPCINSAGAIMPINPEVMEYHVVTLDEEISAEKRVVPAPRQTSRSRKAAATVGK